MAFLRFEGCFAQVGIVLGLLSQNRFCSRTTKSSKFWRSMMRLPLARTTYVLSGNGHSSANHGSPEQFRTLHEEGWSQCQDCSYVIQFRQTEDSIGRPVSQILEHVTGGHACSMERYFRGSKGRATARRSSLCVFSLISWRRRSYDFVRGRVF